MFVITADQRDSRTNADLVPEGIALVERVGADRLTLPVQRNAGDELQALTDSAAAALQIGLALLRDGRWSVGIGAGAARVAPACRHPRGARLRRSSSRGRRSSGPSPSAGRVAVAAADPVAAADAEAYLRLLVDLRDRRSAQGWEVADLLGAGLDAEAHRRRARHHPHRGEPARQGRGAAARGGGHSRARAHARPARPVTRVCPSVGSRRERLTACL